MTTEELIAEGQRLKKCIGRKDSSSFVTDVSTWETQCTFMLDSVKASREVRSRLMLAFANFKYHSYKETSKIDEIIGILKGIPSGEQTKVMAKKTSKTKTAEVVTISDSQQSAVTNSCTGKRPIGPSGDYKSMDIKSMIRDIRGQQVMLDFELAMLYGVETKALNQAVKRNINRFPEDFMFQLNKQEFNTLKSQIVTSNIVDNQQNIYLRSQIVTAKDISKVRTLPYAFTRNGIGMLSSVLRSETAVGVNILIMRAFTAIPQIVNQNVQMVQRIFNIEQHQMETDKKIELILDKIEEIAPKQLPEQIFRTGCVWDAWTYVSDLVRNAKQRIVLIDNFVDDRVLSLLDKRTEGVEATIYSRYFEQFQTDLKKHNEQYPAINFVQLPHKNHDRFLIIDDEVYFLGASLKDVGTSLCAVKKMEVSPDRLLEFLK